MLTEAAMNGKSDRVVDREERAAVVVDPGSCGCTVVTDLGIVDQHVAGASRTSAVVYAADVDTATEICCRISRDDGVGYGARSSVFEEDTAAV